MLFDAEVQGLVTSAVEATLRHFADHNMRVDENMQRSIRGAVISMVRLGQRNPETLAGYARFKALCAVMALD